MNILTLPNLIHGNIQKRPSKVSKTPYVADVTLENNSENTICCHTPSLGCCGMADAGSTVLMSLLKNKNCISKYRAELSIHSEHHGEVVVGINPKLAETIAEQCLKKDLIHNLTCVQEYQREKTYMNSRFDFAGIDSTGTEFIMEIKAVPQADYVDVDQKNRKNFADYISKCDFNNKIAYFPDGFRKSSSKKEPISVRALKHIQELEILHKVQKIRTILCFIIQRSDTNVFQTSHIDPIYREAVYKAYQSGVEIKTIQVHWTRSGECNFVSNTMPIILTDTIGPWYQQPLKKLVKKKIF